MAFVDGYNLYHGIVGLARGLPGKPETTKHFLKWVNLWNLVQAFTKTSSEELVGVHYFSAYATWLKDPCLRWRILALQPLPSSARMKMSKRKSLKKITKC